MSYWYPFRSREVADITSHLTPEEDSSLRASATNYGSWMGPRIGVVSVVTVLSSSHFLHSFFASLIVSLAVTLIVIWTIYGSRMQKQRKWNRDFLCSTAYGRQSGYRPDSLRLCRFW
jgi:hypothetical protein